ncbi:hypothetical protein [Caldisalinibacter kiritimatiensis]|uniref:Uncharacterized protein n=1 Tax=Caldisalinibacter kiritimatiensis TaxID=1304284 RepID=R1AUP3_9FIRM|nr:hypothetical protein [Caldisalinibacter kiritimatiensis]EOD00873.1 hypothetical protein L21TH_1076 [Caldisalinibacter kiritimatiensis]
MNNKFKRIVSIIIVFTVCFSSTQVFAVNGNGNISLKDKKDKSEEITINTYMGTFHIRELTDESIKEDMLNKIMEYKKTSNSNIISPLYVPEPGDESILLYGPLQKYSYNRLSKTIIKAACDAAIFLVPSGILLTKAKNAYKLISATIAYVALDNYLGEVGDDIPDDNWYEVWQWKYYSDYYNEYVIMTTVVFYADEDYSDPVSVTYYETDIETN